MEQPPLASKFRLLGHYDRTIFWPLVILYGGVIAYALANPAGLGALFTGVQNFIIKHLAWLILLVGTTSILFCLWMGLGRYADIKLGKADEKPEFSFFAWVSMLFCTGLGTGFVIFGTAEPLYHVFQAPTVLDAGTAGTIRAVPEAVRLAVVNWGLFCWPLFAVGGWAIGYAAYRHDKPLRTSTGLYGLLGERCNDALFSKAVDVLAGIGTIGGVAMMIGLGVASISYAFHLLFGITLNPAGKLGVMLCFIVIYTASSATGLARGIRCLSESNGYITLGLLAAVLVLGATPFVYIMNLLLQSTGEFLFRLPQTLFWTDASDFEPRGWSGSWFIFYILWNISYVPFTGGFVARISRGRTMREFVWGVSLVPILMCLVWFTVWGGNACYLQFKGSLDVWGVVQDNPEQALYMLLGIFPLGKVLCYLAFTCFCLFAITTADSASYFIAQQTTNGTVTPSLLNRLVWGSVIGLTGIIFQITGGFTAIKSLVIVAGSPFVLVALAYIISIVKMMRKDAENAG